jgi:hypothetical protein
LAPPAQPPQRSRADQKLQDLKGAVQTLKTITVSASSQQKSAAAAKLEALKQRLKMLRMMSGGDPKALARAAAQLAKEIGQAAKDYAAAGGSPAEIAAPAQSTPPAEEGAPVDAASAPGDTPREPGKAPVANEDTGEGADLGKLKQPTVPSTPGIQVADPAMEQAKQLAAGARALLEAAIARAKREHHGKAGDFREELGMMKAADKDIDDAARRVAAADAPIAYGPGGESLSAAAAPSLPATAIKA